MRKISALLITAGLLLAAASPARGSVNIFADPQINESVIFTGGAGNGGGPYSGHLLGSDTYWNTFCVEADGAVEWFVPGDTYQVWNTSSSTATASGNTVTDIAKWLYWQYGTNQSAITGMYLGQTYTYSGTYNDRTSLQEAIWHGVLKTNGDPLAEPMSNTAWGWYNTAETAVLADPDAWFLDSVFILNPGPAPSGYPGFGEAQSMLYATIPEPATTIVWTLLGAASWLGMGVWRRGQRFIGSREWPQENRAAIFDLIEHGR